MKSITLTRRALSIAVASLFAATTLPALVQAQALNEPQEGQQYRVMKPRVATSAGDKKIEVIEFFWFGCPHCNSLDPSLEAWLKKAPADVAFKRVHINFDSDSSPVKRTETHQRLFLTLEALGLNATQNAAVFNAIHADRKNLNTRDGVLDWAKSRNLDMTKFTATYDDAFTMSRKMKAASSLQEAYKVDGVPYFAVDGQYITSPSIAGGEAGFYNTLDFLINKSRKDRGLSHAAEKKEEPKKAETKKTDAKAAKKEVAK
jgi:protein dithiol oxidoreductase (disulfide-forming)